MVFEQFHTVMKPLCVHEGVHRRNCSRRKLDPLGSNTSAVQEATLTEVPLSAAPENKNVSFVLRLAMPAVDCGSRMIKLAPL